MADEQQPIIIKKKKGGHGGHHGGAWKLALADLMTAMMTFFLVMWIVGMDVKTRAGLAEYFSNPGAFRVDTQSSPYILKMDGRPPLINATIEQTSRKSTNVDVQAAEALASRIRTALRVDARFKDQLDAVDIRVTDDGLMIEFIESSVGLLFEPGTAAFKPLGQQMLQAVIPVLIGANRGLDIRAHADARLIADPRQARWELASERAGATRRLLAAGGLRPTQFRRVVNLGPTQPRIADAPSSVQNNRIILAVPFDVE
jgi:chemotaxis protein MotB